ncbi:MAG TPA: hypothetical protein VMA54_18375 [Steroidobacteraceae bacterium]|nr:hypothetical protein [Steroidobacteraceae bacterium]
MSEHKAIPEPLTAAECAALRRSSDAAMAYFRARLAARRTLPAAENQPGALRGPPLSS